MPSSELMSFIQAISKKNQTFKMVPQRLGSRLVHHNRSCADTFVVCSRVVLLSRTSLHHQVLRDIWYELQNVELRCKNTAVDFVGIRKVFQLTVGMIYCSGYICQAPHRLWVWGPYLMRLGKSIGIVMVSYKSKDASD